MGQLGQKLHGPARPYELTLLGRVDAFVNGLYGARHDRLDMPTFEKFRISAENAAIEAEYKKVNQPIEARVIVPYTDGRCVPLEFYRELTRVTPQPAFKTPDYFVKGDPDTGDKCTVAAGSAPTIILAR